MFSNKDLNAYELLSFSHVNPEVLTCGNLPCLAEGTKFCGRREGDAKIICRCKPGWKGNLCQYPPPRPPPPPPGKPWCQGIADESGISRQETLWNQDCGSIEIIEQDWIADSVSFDDRREITRRKCGNYFNDPYVGSPKICDGRPRLASTHSWWCDTGRICHL